MRKWIVLWVASLVAVAIVSSALTVAQAPVPRLPAPGQPEPRVVSGGELGFRVEGIDPYTGRPTGRIVVQVDGEWVEAAFSAGVRRLN